MSNTTNPLAILWGSRATIYEHQEVTDPVTFKTVHKAVAVVKDEPCRVSFSQETVVNATSGVPTLAQKTVLIIRPDLVVKPGSTIEVVQLGRTMKYRGSSEAAVYTHHQEITLKQYEDHA